MLWLLLLTLLCLGASVPMTPAPDPETELVGIIGGHDAQPGKWPWQVSLWIPDMRGEWFSNCGGSLIHWQWVLTAAHCVKGPHAVNHVRVRVQVGHLDLNPRNMLQEVAQVILHPKSHPQDTRQGRDIALLKLNAPVTPSATVQVVKLPPPELRVPPGTKCTVTGWGDISHEGWLLSNKTLQEVQVPIVDPEECRQIYQKFPVVMDGTLCAGSPGQNFCKGDSGGPLVCHIASAWVQVGLVSWTVNPCERNKYPGVYTQVTFYLPWIRSHVPLLS